MAKRYLYLDNTKNKILFETVQPNRVSIAQVDMMVLAETGVDPRINPVDINRSICVVPDKVLDMVNE